MYLQEIHPTGVEIFGFLIVNIFGEEQTEVEESVPDFIQKIRLAGHFW